MVCVALHFHAARTHRPGAGFHDRAAPAITAALGGTERLFHVKQIPINFINLRASADMSSLSAFVVFCHLLSAETYPRPRKKPYMQRLSACTRSMTHPIATAAGEVDPPGLLKRRPRSIQP